MDSVCSEVTLLHSVMPTDGRLRGRSPTEGIPSYASALVQELMRDFYSPLIISSPGVDTYREAESASHATSQSVTSWAAHSSCVTGSLLAIKPGFLFTSFTTMAFRHLSNWKWSWAV